MELGTLTTSRLRRTRIRRSSQNPIKANFGEFHKGELRRILIPRTTVNKGKKKGRSYDARPFS